MILAHKPAVKTSLQENLLVQIWYQNIQITTMKSIEKLDHTIEKMWKHFNPSTWEIDTDRSL